MTPMITAPYATALRIETVGSSGVVPDRLTRRGSRTSQIRVRGCAEGPRSDQLPGGHDLPDGPSRATDGVLHTDPAIGEPS